MSIFSGHVCYVIILALLESVKPRIVGVAGRKYGLSDSSFGILGQLCQGEKIVQGRSYVDENINISNCFFARTSQYSGYGGVIYVKVGSISIVISDSMFYNCVCSEQGGAIFFISTVSSLRKVCANRCSASIYYNFACLQASQMNHVEYLSVSQCSPTAFGRYGFLLYTGNQRLEKTNSSMNNAILVSGIYISSPLSFESSHCTFSNNKVTDSRCIYFNSNTGTTLFANIIHNNSPNEYGVIYLNGNGTPKMIYCIFQNNHNILFCVLTGSLDISHSFIDHLVSSFTNSNSITTVNNNTFTKIPTYRIQFFKSHYCNAELPIQLNSHTALSSQIQKRTMIELVLLIYV